MVVAHKAKETMDRTCGARHRPVMDGLHLGRVHGDARLGDDVAEVGHRGDAESALGALDEELVLAEHGEDGAQMS